MKTVYLVCATGIATSTMLRMKVEEFLAEQGIQASVYQFRVTELNPARIDADVIIATTGLPADFAETVPVINGVPLITGVGQDKTFEELLSILKTET